MNPIEKAIAVCGSESRLAELAGVSQPAINKAKKLGRATPGLAVAISRATGGKVLIADLVPEVFEAVREEIARGSVAEPEGAAA